jgi:hypothetical protein
MKRYEFTELRVHVTGIRINCTDEDTLEWITGEIKKVAPDCLVRDAGAPGWRSFEEIAYKKGAISWQIFTELCHKGWEPYAHYEGQFAGGYFLRLELDLSEA